MEIPFHKELKEFNDLHGEIGALFHDAAADAGISDSVQNILYTIVACGGDCTQMDISRQSGMSRQTIHSAVRLLQQQGLLHLEGGHKNKALRLTDAGLAYAEKTVFPIITAEKAVFDSWSPEDRRDLLRLTRKYLTDLREEYEKIRR